MGSKLSVLAAVQLTALIASTAAADNKKALARQLFELAIEEYKTKDYAAASASLAKAHALDPQPETLYALAQAERLAGNCKEAIPHYQSLLETTKNEKTQKAVTENLELCRQIEAGKQPVVAPETDAKIVEQRDAPTIEYRTVVRTERKSDAATIATFVAGGVALSGGAALFLVARSTRADADRATTLTEYNDKFDKAQRFQWMSYGAAGLGVGLITYGIIRVVRGGGSSERSPSDVAIVPVAGGSLVSWSGSW